MTSRILLAALILLLTTSVYAQQAPNVDNSPMDISYLRVNGKRSSPVVRIVYGRPQKKNRTMLGGQEPFGKVWRTGANETTEIKIFSEIKLGGVIVPAGTYSLYTIPDEKEWTIIINGKTDTWGAYEYEPTLDIVRFRVGVNRSEAELEYFSIWFEGLNGSANLLIGWEKYHIKIPVEFQI